MFGEELGYGEAAELAVEVGKTMNLGRVPATSLTKVLEEDFGVKIFYREELSASAGIGGGRLWTSHLDDGRSNG